MLKKVGFVGLAAAAGMIALGGAASAATAAGPGDWDQADWDQSGQVGLVNVNNLDVAHNVNTVAGVCDNNINVLGVQVPVREVANGIGVPVLSPGHNEAEGNTPYNCAAGSIEDGGSVQSN